MGGGTKALFVDRFWLCCERRVKDLYCPRCGTRRPSESGWPAVRILSGFLVHFQADAFSVRRQSQSHAEARDGMVSALRTGDDKMMIAALSRFTTAYYIPDYKLRNPALIELDLEAQIQWRDGCVRGCVERVAELDAWCDAVREAIAALEAVKPKTGEP